MCTGLEERAAKRLEKLADRLEALQIASYIELLEKPRKLIITNFVAGIFRGLGFALGTTIVFAIIIEMLRRIILLNVPLLSNYLVDVIRMIEQNK
ncbi:MAG: hypothetical protein GX348_01975 [Veillonellaceae bacterium]|jgi:hypothetical protein|nr:hypothetical protein [Veillonellaceae bacterium]